MVISFSVSFHLKLNEKGNIFLALTVIVVSTSKGNSGITSLYLCLPSYHNSLVPFKSINTLITVSHHFPLILLFNTIQFKNKKDTAEILLKIIKNIWRRCEDTVYDINSTTSIDFKGTSVRSMPECTLESPGHHALSSLF